MTEVPVIHTEPTKELEAPIAIPVHRSALADAVALLEVTYLDIEQYHNTNDTPLHEAKALPNSEEVTVTPPHDLH